MGEVLSLVMPLFPTKEKLFGELFDPLVGNMETVYITHLDVLAADRERLVFYVLEITSLAVTQRNGARFFFNNS